MILARFGKHNLAAALETYPAACMIDQHLAHGAGGEREKVGATVFLRGRTRGEFEIDLVHQGRCIQGGRLTDAASLVMRNPAEFFVGQSKQAFRCLRGLWQILGCFRYDGSSTGMSPACAFESQKWGLIVSESTRSPPNTPRMEHSGAVS